MCGRDSQCHQVNMFGQSSPEVCSMYSTSIFFHWLPLPSLLLHLKTHISPLRFEQLWGSFSRSLPSSCMVQRWKGQFLSQTQESEEAKARAYLPDSHIRPSTLNLSRGQHGKHNHHVAQPSKHCPHSVLLLGTGCCLLMLTVASHVLLQTVTTPNAATTLPLLQSSTHTRTCQIASQN